MTEPWNAQNTPKTDQAKQQAGALADTTKGEARNVADTASQKAGEVKDVAAQNAAEVKDHAVDRAQDVKDTALDAGQQVAGTAKVEAANVVDDARDQIRGLIDTTMGEVRSRATDGQIALTGTLEGLTSELSKVARGETTTGPVNQFVQEIAQRGEGLTSWLQSHEPDDIVVEARRFAARRPVAFLAIAAGAGMLAGRVARGTRDLAQDQKDATPRLAGTYQRTGYQAPVQTGYTQTGYVQPTGYQGAQYRDEQVRTTEYTQPRVSEGYVHTTDTLDNLDRGTEGGLR